MSSPDIESITRKITVDSVTQQNLPIIRFSNGEKRLRQLSTDLYESRSLLGSDQPSYINLHKASTMKNTRTSGEIKSPKFKILVGKIQSRVAVEGSKGLKG